MATSSNSLRIRMEQLFARFGLTMRGKLIILFVVIKVVPLVLLAMIAWGQFWRLGEDMKFRTAEIADKALEALARSGEIAVTDAVHALDDRATEDIERMSTDAARRVAEFLYARDADALFVASLEPDESVYRKFIDTQRGRIVKQGEWKLAPDGKDWIRADNDPPMQEIVSSIKENDRSFHYRPPELYEYENRPLYLEMTFLDLEGREQIKVTTSPLMDPALNDVSQRENTFVKAEKYFPELKHLKPGEIYVSEVIGEYVGSQVIGMYTPQAAAKAGIPFDPEKSAYAGMENPLGKRFNGVVRWATPVVQDGEITGYVTLALDHDHLMEFMAHLMPTSERYTKIPDASEGNYAFIWDHKGRSIVHPRHFSISGYDAKTGDPQVPWLEDSIYRAWRESGKSYADFIVAEPTFVEQSNDKKPSLDLKKQGLVGLDCRYLNFAPQCTGWFDLTREGGSGSFTIFWSDLLKLNTAAAIPYYTGQYGESSRGFGFVAIGAGLDDFHRPATETGKAINQLFQETDSALKLLSKETYASIGRKLLETAAGLGISTVLMILLVIFIAIWMASAFTRSIRWLINGISRFRSGEWQYRFHAEVKDEMGTLADSFDEMADSIVDSVKEAMTIISLDKKVLYMNGKALSLAEKTLDEVVGHLYSEVSIFPEGSRYCPITALLENTETMVFPLLATGRFYKGKASYLTNKEGENIGYIIVATDVTHLVSEQQKLEQQRALLEKIFSSSPDLIWYQDDKGRYLAVNPRFASLVGKRPDELRGRTVADVFSPELASSFMGESEKAKERRRAAYSEHIMRFADGHEETLDMVRTPLYNVGNEFIGVLGVARDVSRRAFVESELRSTQERLEKTAAEANKASESKSRFLARMSHEIRTPMNAIIGMSNIVRRKLKDGKAPVGEVLGHMNQIEISSAHLLGLINDILDISKVEAGKIELCEEAFDLTKLVGNVASIIRPRCQEKNITFDVRLEEMESENIIGDSLRLRQVLINLLGNAVKFTPECGAVSLHVRQEDRQDDRVLVGFSVSDSGIGISKEVLPTLFKPFEQGSKHVNGQYGGTGLGLSISKSFVNLMGGDISVRSQVDKGSTFSFSLWFSLGADALQETSVCAQDGNSALSGKRVLLVDDVDINRVILKEQLSYCGMIVEEAEDGQAALERFSEVPENYYDIIFMDVQMPRMNGYEAASAIRQLDRNDARAIPIVAMTANAFKEDVDRAMEHGMNAHLAKPLESEKLMEVLHRFLSAKERQ